MNSKELLGATFVVPINNDADEPLRGTLDSLLAFRNRAYSNSSDCQIMCVGEIPNANKLRDYAKEHAFCPGHDAQFSVYPTSEWSEMERESFMPEVAASLTAGAGLILMTVVVLIAPGAQINSASNSVLSNAIQAVGDDPQLLVISQDRDNTTQVSSGAFSTIALETRGIGLPAADGMPIVLEKKFLGGFRFSRTTKDVKQNVQWLISTIGFQYQETGLKSRFDSWT